MASSTGTKFMESPLVVWVETFRPKGSPSLDYCDLYDGVFLCDVMNQIDGRSADFQDINRNVRDVNIRLQNWDILLRNIKAYYLDALQQLVLLRLPNIQAICREPGKESSFNELKKALLLILGCAVQSEKKETFIETIKGLNIQVQTEIVESIKLITNDCEAVLPTAATDQLEPYTEKVYNHLVRLLNERDDVAEMMTDLVQERDFYQAQAEGKATPLSPTGSPEKHHLVVELADYKARVRRLRQELEEKQEHYSDLMDEMEEQKALLAKFRNENVELVKDARAARALRDELDILQEKMGQISHYEAELLKYKEKLNQMDFYKARVQELSEDNAIMIENKHLLEEQLSKSQNRVETVIQLEQELVKKRQQIEELSSERDADRERIRLLAEENAQLQFDRKSNMNESTNLEKELQATNARLAGVGGTISDQLKETTNAKILRLELENQRLHQKIEDMRETSLIENTGLTLQLEKENQRLARKVEQLQMASQETAEHCFDLEEKSRNFDREKEHLQQAIELTRESAERQVKELEREKDDLSQTVAVIRVRNEQTNDTKLKDLEKDNKRLHETVSVKNQQLSKVEFENKQLTKTYQRTKEIADKVSELEVDKEHLDKENFELRKKVQTQEVTCDKVDKLEQDYSDLEIENRNLKKTVASLKASLQKKDQLEQDNITLTVENQKLQRTLDSMKNSSSKVAELENDKDMLNRELQQLRRSMESKRSQGVKLEKMELDLMDLDNENMKLQKTLEITNNRVVQLEKDNNDLENESEKLQETIESMKFSQKRLSELEKENSELEQECMKIQKEFSMLSKDNKRFKVTMDSRESAIDQLTSRNVTLEREMKDMRRHAERQAVSSSHSKEVEKDNRELQQQLIVEQQTVGTLRGDLVNEKIRTQELNNEMEKLNQDLQKVGIKKDALVKAAHPSGDGSRFKALESMMEDTLKKSMEIKDDKIQALQSRLDESKNRNLKQQEDLRMVKRECESLKQGYEEEALGKEREKHDSRLVRNSPFMNPQNSTKEIFELKDHLVKVERNNATLMAENRNLKSQTDSMNEQIQKLESQNQQLHSQTSSMHGQSGALQSQNAKLQVENSTLQSKCTSLHGHIATLQNQISKMDSERDRLNQMYDDLKRTHEQLMQDNVTLQSIHEQSTKEYESLISEHGSLKSLHKTLKNENRELQERLNALQHGKVDESTMRNLLESERNDLHMERKSLGNLQMDYNRLRDEHDQLSGVHVNLEKDYRDVLAENKKAKTELNAIQQEYVDLKNKLWLTKQEFELLSGRFMSLDDNYQKSQEDKESLMQQVDFLIERNQDLLNHMLNSKDQNVGKEKQYMEQLSDLRRQKERLEEKIMDHYKNREKQKKNRSLGQKMVQKVRGLMKTQRSKSRPNLAEGSPDTSSTGSLADESRHSDHHQRRRGSAGNLAESQTDSPKLSKQNKNLAKSTTALSVSSPYNASNSDLRGMGRPTSDDEGGFRSNNVDTGIPDMMTMEEFLSETLDKSSPKAKRKLEAGKQEDSESRSSDASDNSRRLQSRKPAPLPPTNLRMAGSSIPDVTAVSQHDLSVSRMSRVSTGSSGSSQDVRESAFTQVSSPPSHMQPTNTSTPAKNIFQYRTKPYDDHNTSAFTRVDDTSRPNGSGSHEPVTPIQSRISQYDQGYSQHSTSSRDQTPEQDSHLTVGDRLDMLTRGTGPLSPNSSSNSGGWSPASNYSSPRDQRSRNEGDMSIRSAQGHSDMSPHQNWSQVAGPGSSRPPMRAAGPMPRSHSPGRLQKSDDRSPARPSSNSSNTPTSGKREKTILVSRANVGPRPYGQKSSNIIRARPQSAFGAPMRNTFQGDNNDSQLNNSRIMPDHIDGRASYDTSYNNGPSNGPSKSLHNGPSHAPSHQNLNTSRQGNQQRVERPKSVPPSMFNADGSIDSNNTSLNNNNYQSSPPKGPPPVPPPRKTRDILTMGRYSVLREPNSAMSSIPSSVSMNSSRGAPLNNSQSNVINSPSGDGGAGSGHLSSNSVPRIGSQTQNRLSQHKSPAPKPMKPEEQDGEPKKNSICIFTSSIEV